MAEPKHLNSIPIDHKVQSRPNIPSDYHCTCPYCQNFMGEIYNVENDKYYSNRIRKEYYIDKAGDHLDAGHVIGYKWAVQNLCPEGGYVFDPTAGTGTAVVEAILNKRNGIGIELEYPEVGQKNIDYQFSLNRVPDGITSYFRQGDATKLDEYFKEWRFEEPFLDLIINGTPYPKISGKSSDSPERKNLITKIDKSFDYRHEDNIGLTKGDAYYNLVKTMYTKAIHFLKPGGYFVIIIKDLVQNKEPYLLHKEIIDIVIENNPDMIPYGFFLHKHIPTTMFINTYLKRFPGIRIPLYQAGIVLRKNRNNEGLGTFLFPGCPVEKERIIREISNQPSKPKKVIVPQSIVGIMEKIQKEKWIKEYDRGYRDGYQAALDIISITIKNLKKST